MLKQWFQNIITKFLGMIQPNPSPTQINPPQIETTKPVSIEAQPTKLLQKSKILNSKTNHLSNEESQLHKVSQKIKQTTKSKASPTPQLNSTNTISPSLDDDSGWAEFRQHAEQTLMTHILTYAEAHVQPTAEDYNALELYWEGGALEQAMQTAHEQQQPRTVIRLAWALCRPVDGYLRVRGHWKALGQFLPWAREAAQQVGDEYDEAAFNEFMATLFKGKGQLDVAQQIYEQNLVIWQKLDNQKSVAVTYHNLAMIAHDQADYATAKRMYEQSLAIKQQLGDQALIATSYHQLGNLAKDEGDTATAKRMYEQSLAIKQQLGNQADIATTIGQLAQLAQKAGDLPQAEAMYRQVMEIGEQVGDVVMVSILMFNLALLYEAQGRLAEAVPLLEQAEAVFDKVGSPNVTVVRKLLARVRGKMN